MGNIWKNTSDDDTGPVIALFSNKLSIIFYTTVTLIV